MFFFFFIIFSKLKVEKISSNIQYSVELYFEFPLSDVYILDRHSMYNSFQLIQTEKFSIFERTYMK